MNDDEATAAAFELRLREVLEVYGKPAPSQAALRSWWRVLADLDLAVVDQALTAHLSDSRFAPTPAEVLARIRAADGRPGPDEAWSIALRSADEADTVVWTAEIATARAAALPILGAGDEVGARRAFLEVYQRELDAARRALRPVRWAVSLGTDPSRRVGALHEAEALGRLPPARIAPLLPAGPHETGRVQRGGDGPAPVAALLGGKITALPPDRARDRRQLLAAVRAGIEQGAAERVRERERRRAQRAAEDEAQVRARTQRRQRPLAEHAAEIRRELDRRRGPSGPGSAPGAAAAGDPSAPDEPDAADGG